MTDETDVIDDVELQDVDAPEADNEADVEEASRIGWTPKEHFKGDPDKWVSAKEFLKRGRERLPLVQAELRRTQDRLAAVEKSAHALAEHHKKTEKLAYERAMQDLKRQRAEAISALDGDKVNEIDDKLYELRSNNQKEAEVAANRPPEFFEKWLQDNTWTQDEEGEAIASAIASKLAKQHPELVGKPEILDKITEEARKKYPQLFPELSNPRRAQPAAVASGSPAKAKAKKTLSDLPPDARDACRDFVKRGYMTEAEYLKDYFGEQA